MARLTAQGGAVWRKLSGGGGGAPARPSVCPAVPAQQPRACSADPFPKPTPETNSFHLEKRLRIQLDATLSPNSTEKTLLFPDD